MRTGLLFSLALVLGIAAASPAWSAPAAFLGCPAAPALQPGAVAGTPPARFASGSACTIVCPSPHIKPWYLYCPANATYCSSTSMVCDGTVLSCEQCDDFWVGGPVESQCSWTDGLEDR
jgi:hypothetical protein